MSDNNGLADQFDPVDGTPAPISIFNDWWVAYADPQGSKQLYYGNSTADDHTIPGAYLNGFPAVANYRESLFVAHRSAADDNKLYYSRYDGTSWSSSMAVSGALLNESPGMAVFQSCLYVAYQNAAGDHLARYSIYDGLKWSGSTTVLPNVYLDASPAMAVFGNKLYLAHQGAESHNSQGHTLCYTTFDGTNWSPDITLSNISMTGSPSMAVGGDGKLYLGYQGYGSAEATSGSSIWCVTYDGSTWSPPFSIGWSELPITPSSSPALFSAEGGKVWLAYLSGGSVSMAAVPTPTGSFDHAQLRGVKRRVISMPG